MCIIMCISVLLEPRAISLYNYLKQKGFYASTVFSESFPLLCSLFMQSLDSVLFTNREGNYLFSSLFS